MNNWNGRIDDPNNPATFRWHQVIQPLSISPIKITVDPSIALVGFKSDEGIARNLGRIGAAEGPHALRQALANLPVINNAILWDAGDITCVRSNVSGNDNVSERNNITEKDNVSARNNVSARDNVSDQNNISEKNNNNLENAQIAFAEKITELLDHHYLPIGLGGGHEIGFASYLGLANFILEKNKKNPLPHLNAHKKPKVAIINFDAHFDLRDQAQASSGTPFLQALQHAEQNKLSVEYICFGISRSSNTPHLFNTAKKYNVWYELDENINFIQLPHIIETLKQRLFNVDMIYLSICLDVFPQAVAPGVSAPNPRGISFEYLELLFNAIAETDKVKLMDIAELSPQYDRDNATAKVAARIIHQLSDRIISIKN